MTELVSAPTATLASGSLLAIRDASDPGLKKTTMADVATFLGSGAGAWQRIVDFTIASAIANYDIPIPGFSEIILLALDVTTSVAGIRAVQVSVDNGTTFYSTSGNYSFLNGSGAKTADSAIGLHGGTTSSAARGGVMSIRGNNLNNTIKIIDTPTGSSYGTVLFTASNLPITTLRVFNSAGGGNLTGGRIIVLGK